MAQVGKEPLHRAEYALPGAPDEFFRHHDRGDGHTGAVGEGHRLVVAADEAVLDLLLGGRDDSVRETPAQVHRHQGDDLQRLARAGRLFDKDVSAGPTKIGHQPHLIAPQLLGGRFHERILEGRKSAVPRSRSQAPARACNYTRRHGLRHSGMFKHAVGASNRPGGARARPGIGVPLPCSAALLSGWREGRASPFPVPCRRSGRGGGPVWCVEPGNRPVAPMPHADDVRPKPHGGAFVGVVDGRRETCHWLDMPDDEPPEPPIPAHKLKREVTPVACSGTGGIVSTSHRPRSHRPPSPARRLLQHPTPPDPPGGQS